MNRRHFNKLSLVAGLTALSQYSFSVPEVKKTLLPARLRKGDNIGVISPGSAARPEQVETGIQQIKALGFNPVPGKNLGKKKGYLAGSDQERLADLHDMFADPTIAGIWCIRGGYGCSRLLPNIDYKLIKKNPKALMGYSDITALFLAIHKFTGLIGFHGPVAQPVMDPFTLNHFEQILMEANIDQGFPVYQSKEKNEYHPLESMQAGRAEGALIGGNLSLLSALCGTPFGMDAKGKIVFIEDVGEKPYRIDRMLTQLLQASNLPEAKGIVLGQFNGCEAKSTENSLTLTQCLEDRLGDLGIPILRGMSFGHVDHILTLPVGAKVSLDANKKTMQLLAPVVR